MGSREFWCVCECVCVWRKNGRVYLSTNDNNLVERGKLIMQENIIIQKALRHRRVEIHTISREVSF